MRDMTIPTSQRYNAELLREELESIDLPVTAVGTTRGGLWVAFSQDIASDQVDDVRNVILSVLDGHNPDAETSVQEAKRLARELKETREAQIAGGWTGTRPQDPLTLFLLRAVELLLAEREQ